VLRFRNEQLTVALCPEQVGVIWRPRKGGVRRDLVGFSDDPHGSGWRGALDAWSTWLQDCGIRQAHVSLTLSNRFVRYVLIPWPSTRLTREEADAWCNLHFEMHHGDMRGWRVASEIGRYGGAKVACAIPEELADSLQELHASNGLTGGSVVPYFVCCWNRWGGQIPTGHRFVVAESGCVVLACRGRNEWQNLRGVTARTSPEELVVIARREQVLQGQLHELRAVFHSPGLMPPPQDSVTSPRMAEWLGLDGVGEGTALAMARSMEG